MWHWHGKCVLHHNILEGLSHFRRELNFSKVWAHSWKSDHTLEWLLIIFSLYIKRKLYNFIFYSKISRYFCAWRLLFYLIVIFSLFLSVLSSYDAIISIYCMRASWELDVIFIFSLMLWEFVSLCFQWFSYHCMLLWWLITRLDSPSSSHRIVEWEISLNFYKNNG